MAAPRKNQFAVGNKGGGRKPLIDEIEKLRVLEDAFFKGINIRNFEKISAAMKANKGKVKLLDYMFFRSFKNDKVLIALMKKVFPDKFEGKTEVDGLADALAAVLGGAPIPQPPEEPPEE